MQGFPAANGNAEDFWKQSSFTYKLCCLSSTLIFLFSLFLPALIIFFIDIPELTIWSFQIWRLFLSFYGQMPNIMSILSLLFSFMWMYNMLKDEEFSTVYRVFQIVVLNFQIHLVFNLICLVFTLLLTTEGNAVFYGFGWFPIIIVYEFRASAINPEAERRFCCLPFLIKNRYYPWVLLVLLGLLSSQFLCFIACGLVGYYQEIVRKSMFIKLPMKFYTKIQSWLPESIKSRTDFTQIAKVQQLLNTRCYNSSPVAQQPQQNQPNNPFNYNNPQFQQAQQYNQNSQQNQDYLGGNATTIGGRPVTDFRNYWAKKDQVGGASKPVQQIQIEPRENNYPAYTIPNPNSNPNSNPNAGMHEQYQNQNDSYANFNEHGLQSRQLLGEGEREDQFARKGRKGKGKGKEGGDSGNDLI